MIFLRSVVGKLWSTILLLVSFVLLILTVLLLEFFENFHVQQVKQELYDTAVRLTEVLEEDQNPDAAMQLSAEFLDPTEELLIVDGGGNNILFHQPADEELLSLDYLKEDQELSAVWKDQQSSTKEAVLEGNGHDATPVLIVGVPLAGDRLDGAVYMAESLDSMNSTTQHTTKFIILAAGVAIILTTIFAFFLSSRITAPLRKMREAAFEVARGKFDTKVPYPSSDEIGELATAFNQMGKQLKFNMNALSQEKENLANILSSMADGVITINIDGTILATNPPADRFIQYWYKENNIDGKDSPLELMELFQHSVETEKEQVSEIQIGDHYWAVIVSPLYTNQNIRGAVAVLRDMTEERQLDKMRNDFIANVSHELRTPISMLQGYSEAIVDDIAGTEDEKKEMAKIIYDESLRMGRLVNELLDLARMEAGFLHLDIDSVQLGPYLRRIMHKFYGLAKEKEIELICEVPHEEAYWKLDSDRIEQVLTNLISNAIRHTQTGGRVIIREDILLGDQLRLQVSNNGSAIPPEDLPFVFERFYKADKARTRAPSGTGTGLGLAIAKNIVKAHNGNITVSSNEVEGTTFTFTIPQTVSETVKK
ncbi:MAG: ATP-binding protein [Bacillus sp. (in: firmicutes)]